MIFLKQIQLDESPITRDYKLTFGFTNGRFQQLKIRIGDSPLSIAASLEELSQAIRHDEQLKDENTKL